jgi:hypothetical protein
LAFTDAEIQAIKAELGYNLLDTGATAYVGVSQLLESVVNSNIDDEVSTTVTLVTAISAASSPTPQTLTLASSTGFSSGAVVYVDVDDRMERRRIQYLSGVSATVLLQKAHSGTIPVSLFGPIPRARELLWRIQAVKEEMAETLGEGAIKKVDEVEFYRPGGRTTTTFGLLGNQLRMWRNELSACLALPNLWEERRNSSALTVY